MVFVDRVRTGIKIYLEVRVNVVCSGEKKMFTKIVIWKEC